MPALMWHSHQAVFSASDGRCDSLLPLKLDSRIWKLSEVGA